MSKFHINPETGKVGSCSATIKQCKYAVNGETPPHYNTAKEAEEAYEKSMSSGTFKQTIKKKKPIKNSEFQTIQNAFPSAETMRKYYSILEKYGEDELSGNKSLVDHPDLYNNPEELFLLYSFMNAQQKASSIEKFIYSKLGGKRVKSSEDRGDAEINDEFYELKTSTTNSNQCLNIRQIRLYQDVDYYICSYIDERSLNNSKTYILTKEEMKEEVDLIGGFTHGTTSSNENKSNPEYSITIPVTKEENKDVLRWNEKYWYNDLYNILQGE